MTDLTGRWNGAYFYPGSNEPIGFLADIRDVGGRISGIIEELTDGPHSSIFVGSVSGSAVRFTKTYDDVARFPDPVEYHGEIDPEESEVAGRWNIRGFSGTFLMTRPRKRKARQSAETAESA